MGGAGLSLAPRPIARPGRLFYVPQVMPEGLARLLKAHQLAGLRFLWANVVIPTPQPAATQPEAGSAPNQCRVTQAQARMDGALTEHRILAIPFLIAVTGAVLES